MRNGDGDKSEKCKESEKSTTNIGFQAHNFTNTKHNGERGLRGKIAEDGHHHISGF